MPPIYPVQYLLLLLAFQGAMKEKRDDKAEREEQLRRRFEHQLRPLTASNSGSGSGKSHIELPKTLNPYERAIAHEVAKALGLKHESRGAWPQSVQQQSNS